MGSAAQSDLDINLDQPHKFEQRQPQLLSVPQTEKPVTGPQIIEEDSDPDQRLCAVLSKKIASTTDEGELAKYFYQRAILHFRMKQFEDAFNDAQSALENSVLEKTLDWTSFRKLKRLQAEASLKLGNYNIALNLFYRIYKISIKLVPIPIPIFDAEEELLFGEADMLVGNFKDARNHFENAKLLAKIDGSDAIAHTGDSFLLDNAAREKKAKQQRKGKKSKQSRNSGGNKNKSTDVS